MKKQLSRWLLTLEQAHACENATGHWSDYLIRLFALYSQLEMQWVYSGHLVYLQWGTVHALPAIYSGHCSYTVARYSVHRLLSIFYTAHTLPASGSVPAVYVQPALQLHWNYTACALHFGLGYLKVLFFFCFFFPFQFPLNPLPHLWW